MKDDSTKDELLSEVLSEAATPSFRQSSLDEMLAVVQRRRVTRKRVQGGLAIAACLLLIIGFGARFLPKQNIAMVQRVDPLLVHSAPLAPGTFVTTEPDLISIVNSSGIAIALVEGMPSGELFEVIGEEKLFALLASRPAALIHHGTSAELVLLDPADANGFQVH